MHRTTYSITFHANHSFFPQPGSDQWDATLNSNVAGAASNAEDFTKQFMSDMYGGGGSGGANQPNSLGEKVN